RAIVAGDLILDTPSLAVLADAGDVTTGARASAANPATGALSVTAAKLTTVADLAEGASLTLLAPADVTFAVISRGTSRSTATGALSGLAVLLVDHVDRSALRANASLT